MADITDIRISFAQAAQAAQAETTVKDMIKLRYALAETDRPSWAKEPADCATLSQAYFEYGDRVAGYDPSVNYPYCAVKRVRREGSELMIDRCGDIVRGFIVTSKRSFFPQPCVALAKQNPGAPFTALCRHEMTVTDIVTLTVIHYDGSIFHTKEMSVEWPKTEDDWSDAEHSDYAIEPDGTLRRLPCLKRSESI